MSKNDDNQNKNEQADSNHVAESGANAPAPVIDMNAAREKIEEKKRLQVEKLQKTLNKLESNRRVTAGSERKYKIARVVQVVLITVAFLYLLNTCGLLKLPA